MPYRMPPKLVSPKPPMRTPEEVDRILRGQEEALRALLHGNFDDWFDNYFGVTTSRPQASPSPSFKP
jgi:hypothetical protein